MTAFRNAVVGTIFLAAAIIVPTTRANADVSIGFSFSAGDVGLALGSLCYEEPVCSYPLYSEPIFVLIPRSHLLSLGKKMSASFGTTVHGGGMNGTGCDPRGSYGAIGGSTVTGTTAGAAIGTGMKGISPDLYVAGRVASTR